MLYVFYVCGCLLCVVVSLARSFSRLCVYFPCLLFSLLFGSSLVSMLVFTISSLCVNFSFRLLLLLSRVLNFSLFTYLLLQSLLEKK